MALPPSQDQHRLRAAIAELDQRVEDMHQAFIRFHHGETYQVPDWERLERELLLFSRAPSGEVELATRMDRVLYKFQNRKQIWLKWIEQVHAGR